MVIYLRAIYKVFTGKQITVSTSITEKRNLICLAIMVILNGTVLINFSSQEILQTFIQRSEVETSLALILPLIVFWANPIEELRANRDKKVRSLIDICKVLILCFKYYNTNLGTLFCIVHNNT